MDTLDVALIPNVTFVPFQAVFAQERSVFVLKGLFLVMLFLIGDVICGLVQGGRADRKRAVSALPGEFGRIGIALFDPDTGNAFEFLHPIGLRDGAGHSTEQMNMIFDAANDERGTFQGFRSATQIRMHFLAKVRIAQKWLAVLGRKDQMKIDA